MKSGISLLLLLFTQCLPSAQMVGIKDKTSGYMGKRGVLSVGLRPIGTFHPTKARAHTEPQAEEKIRVMIEPSVNFDYALNNGISLGFTAGMNRSSALIQPWDYSTDYEGNPAITDMFAGVHVNFFLKGQAGIAPLGNFWTFGLRRHSINGSFEGVRAYTYSWSSNYFDVVMDDTYDVNLTMTTFDLSFGSRNIISDKLTFQWKAGGSLPISMKSTETNLDFREENQEIIMNQIPLLLSCCLLILEWDIS